MSESEDEIPQLPESTLAVLQEFYAEQARALQCLENSDCSKDDLFSEDWQLSQFWYSDETAQILAEEALSISGEGGRIALVSCPTVFRKLKMLKPNCQVSLLEYDKRFSTYTEYIFYDYKDPLNVPQELAGVFDIVIADPPFLSEECLERTSETIKFLAKDKIILCTGAVMEELAKQLLNVTATEFEPKHKNNLANKFRCFANFRLKTRILK